MFAVPALARAQPVRIVGEAGAYAGAIRSKWVTASTGVEGAETMFVSGLRATLAARIEPSPAHAVQLGLVFDLMSERKAVGGVGLQLHGDVMLNPCWRIGARAALSLSTYDSRLGAPDDTDGQRYGFTRHGYFFVLGAQARHRYVALELDLIATEDGGIHYSRSGAGVLASASLIEKPGAYGVASAAAAGALYLVVSWLALRNVNYSE